MGGALSAVFNRSGDKFMPHNSQHWSAVLAAIVLGAGCAAAPQRYPAAPETSQASAAASARTEEINKALSAGSQQTSASSRDYRIGPDDLLQITIFNIPEQETRLTPRNTNVRVSQDGMIALPLV